MASDPGLAAMLLWTISLQALGTAGTNSNEGKSVCVCVAVCLGVCVFSREYTELKNTYSLTAEMNFKHVELLENTLTTNQCNIHTHTHNIGIGIHTHMVCLSVITRGMTSKFALHGNSRKSA